MPFNHREKKIILIGLSLVMAITPSETIRKDAEDLIRQFLEEV